MTTAVAERKSAIVAVPPPSAPTPAAAPPRAPGAAALRALAFLVLLLEGALAWSRQLAPSADRVALQGVAVAAALAVALVAARRLRSPRAWRGAVGLACLAGLVAALPAAGIPVTLLGWHNWSVLTGGVGEGLGALPDLNVPYRGLDDWVRWVMMAGAGLLGVAAAALAFAPHTAAGRVRGSLGAATVLGVLYGVAVVERNPEAPFRSGALWAAGLVVFLGADRLAVLEGLRARAIGFGVAALAVAAAALLAPGLDGSRPLVDYRSFGQSLARGKQDVFDWNHSYSPLRWPRDGRELLRVKAKTAAYWKATTLPRFDGKRWVEASAFDPEFRDTPLARGHPAWYEDIDVTVRALRSQQYLTAGFTSRIFGDSRDALAAGSGSFRTVGRPLKTGDTYSASVYVPKPTSQELRVAGTVYPDYVRPFRRIELPESVGGPAVGPRRTATVEFAAFGAPDIRPVISLPGRGAYIGGEDVLARSAYRRTWALAQRLRVQASSPYALLRSVRRAVQQGTRYTETPRQGRVPLDAFLWDTKEGYCQQFSGAMALVLRMAGVPARVASGFAPGQFDSDRVSYIVRDLDAHSWVEAFFPGIGWVTFDPTPTVAPPSSQDSGDGGESGGDAANSATSSRADTAKATKASAGGPNAAATTSGGGSALPWLAIAVAAAAAAAGATWWRLRHRQIVLGPLEELRRALERSGRPAAPGLTLHGLERSFAGSPAAQDYVRKLRLARYSGTGTAPSRAERAALRRELAAGLGASGRLRAWWALPPRSRRAHPGA